MNEIDEDTICSESFLLENILDISDDYKLSENLLRGIITKNVENLTQVQEELIPHIIRSSNFICSHPSIIGKTLGLIIGSMCKIKKENTNSQILIIANEPCIKQIYMLINDFSIYVKDIFDKYKLINYSENVPEVVKVFNNLDFEQFPIVAQTIDQFNLHYDSNPQFYQYITSIFVDMYKLDDKIIEDLIKIKNNLEANQFGFVLNYIDEVQKDIITKNFNTKTYIIYTNPIYHTESKYHTYINLQDKNSSTKVNIILELLNLVIPPLLLYIDDPNELQELCDKLSENKYNFEIVNKENFKELLDVNKHIYIIYDLIRYESYIKNKIIINYNTDRTQNLRSYSMRFGDTGLYGKRKLVINLVNNDEWVKKIEHLMIKPFDYQDINKFL